ncbi:hypothetical protein ACFL6S_32935, partial [Candidatus Poribacteria bacterium]
MTAERDMQNPYPGPRPFERDEEAVFFGRDREADDLLSLIIAHPVVLLYAQSGAGKTSLLNAGLLPRMEEEEEDFEVLPVARVRGFEQEGVDRGKIDNIYVFNALMSWAGKEADPDSLVSTSITDFLKERAKPTDERDMLLPRLVIFDQFEELFTAYPERWEKREGFFVQIAGALESDPTLRVLFVIREDYLANLTPYAEHLPERLSTRYRLERLRQAAAASAVEGPLQDTDRKFADGVAESLVQELLKVHVRDASGKTVEVTGEYVEPVQLQVVCQNLWMNLPPGINVITAEHLQTFGDVEEALKGFYETAIGTASEKADTEKDDLRGWFNNELITPAGTRGTVFRDEEQDRTGSIPNSAVDLLEEQHIVRAETRAGGRWYELTHDRLIEPIRKANESWLAEEQRRQVEEERQRADAQAREANRFKRLTVALVVVALMAIVATVFAFHQARVAGQRRMEAEKAQKRESEQREIAESERQNALKAAETAQKAQEKEAEQRKVAEEERNRAEGQTRMMVLSSLPRILPLPEA